MNLHNIKILIKSNIPPDYKEQFKKENLSLSLSHIRIICIAFVFLSFYFFYADIKMYSNVDNLEFRKTLFFYHIIGFIISSFYLIIYKKIKNNPDNQIVKNISRLYILIFLISGTLISINSQKLTGNIDGYIIFTFIASITFIYEPLFMIISLTLNHALLMIGMQLLNDNYSMLISKQINATTVYVISIFLLFHLYKQREVEFTYKSKLYKSEANLKKLFSVNPTPLILSRYEDGQILFANKRAYEFYGYTEEEFHNMSFVNLYIDIKDRYEMITKLADSDVIRNYVIEQKLKSGDTKWVIANYELFKYFEQKCIITSVTDISEIKALEDELINHASIDTLTGVLNRRKGIELLTNLIKISQNNNSPLVICFIDVDGLKLVNDNYGHKEGDFLLAKISSIIKNKIRNTDTLFRYGGDEFVILFPDKNTHFVETIWNRIKIELNELNKQNIKPYKFDASHGLFEYNGDELNIDEILDIADKNMYKEKMRKRGLTIGD